MADAPSLLTRLPEPMGEGGGPVILLNGVDECVSDARKQF